MSRLVEEFEGRFVLILIATYKGDITETPGFNEKLAPFVVVTRYRLFHGEVAERCYLQVSQGTKLTDPEHVIITCFGLVESEVTSAVDEFLRTTGIEERNVPRSLLAVRMTLAKTMFNAGALPGWLR